MRYYDKHIMVILMLLLVPIYLMSCSGNTATTLPNDNATAALKPSQPTEVTAVGSDARATISWKPQSGSTIYNLYWDTTEGVTKDSRHIHNVYIPFDHRDLENGKTYYYRVSAQNLTGESDLSVEVQATVRLPFTKILTKLTDPDAEVGDQFGGSVAIDGNYAIVGAPRSAGLDPNNPIPYSGAAYIFQKSATGQWDPAGVKLMAPDAQMYDGFGYKVSISGDYAIVSALYEDDGPGDPVMDAGAAYIFHRIGENIWDTGTKIAGWPPCEGSRFGSAVSIGGDYAVVGAEYEGKVYVFYRTGVNTWSNVTTLPVPQGTETTDRFGYSVAISGDYLIVGAFGEDGDASNSLQQAGAAYVFHRTGMNVWGEFSKIMPHDIEAGDCFGISVAISGDYAAVGANRKKNDTGAVYIFHRIDENFWDEGPKVTAPDAEEEDNFGWSLAMTDKHLLVGSFLEDCGWDNNNAEGSAYLYERIGANSWDSGTKITLPEGEVADSFGYAVAISGESSIIGAIGDDGSANEVQDAGAVYLY